MFRAFLRALGRGVAAALAAIFMPMLESAGRALATLVRWLLVAGAGAGGVLYLVQHHPAELNALIQLGVIFGIAVAGVKIMIRPVRKRPPERRRH